MAQTRRMGMPNGLSVPTKRRGFRLPEGTDSALPEGADSDMILAHP
jgi:hypothetical protein